MQPRTADGGLAPVKIVRADTGGDSDAHAASSGGNRKGDVHTITIEVQREEDVTGVRQTSTYRLSLDEQVRMGHIHDVEQYGQAVPAPYFKLSRREVYGEPGTQRWWA